MAGDWDQADCSAFEYLQLTMTRLTSLHCIVNVKYVLCYFFGNIFRGVHFVYCVLSGTDNGCGVLQCSGERNERRYCSEEFTTLIVDGAVSSEQSWYCESSEKFQFEI